ncbi:cell wall metabolism sensor histidine kinase WalK [Streptomyces sp. NBC_00038]|uniref:sensor histidine kinase n=1 Tax=Streptomyces sp. NBC_00038 TaxID=2903615 RepID=UPI002252DE53|nr:HAMP domain-containing sensor histidine kinase [Streptomyces sp. NBC_00038]MCX5561168.1 HAMP domain-containing histidine kinase [Streptomyces sp. NBC_00038]
MNPAPRSGLDRLRPRTLRAKLTWGLVALLALSCATVGLTSVFALRSYLTRQIDHQLADSGCLFPSSLQQPADTEQESVADDDHADTEADTRGQAIGTFGARLTDAKISEAAVVQPDRRTAVTLDAADEATLNAVPTDGSAHTVTFSALGDYRVYACVGKDDDVLVSGLPLASLQETVHRLTIVSSVVFGGALVITGVTGALWVRRSLRPLRRVTDTAAAVATLNLDSGAVTLPGPTSAGDPHSEAGQVAAALDRMLGHVQEALAKRHTSEERLRSFAADASHELRTPVASIRGHAELALRHPGPVPDKVERALDRVAAEAARMSAMVDDLLLLARLDAGRPLQREPVDVTRLVIDCTDDARAASPGHSWALDLPETPVTVTGDSHRLAQVLTNLLANARLHTPAGTLVTVRLEQREPGQCLLSVTDNGPGIPPELRQTLFERFTRADRRHPGTGTGSAGAGLGLSIAAAVVAAHEGTLTFESKPGSTVFSVLLPEIPL